jgi:2-polyprenyl-3-methyl-5-hydroxy-6-metoxy-1,4-benzoquinol methylase
MRYAAIPQSIPERFALWSGMVPMPILDSLFPILKARALMAGVRLRLFESLEKAPSDAASLASRLRLDGESLELLLRVLTASGYLKERRGRFGVSALARKTLLPGSPMDSRGYVEFNYTQWEFLGRLEELLETGKGIDFHHSMEDGRSWESYQRGMLELARLHAPLLARKIPVPKGAKRLLDIGGSHGLLGAALCRRHPPLKSVVVDLPSAIRTAQRLAEEAGISDVAEHREGNVLKGDYGGVSACDVALLANILHHFSPEQIVTVLRRVHGLLSPHGTVAVWDIDKPGRKEKPELGRDASALYFRLTSTSRCFSAEEYLGWLREAGFTELRVVRPLAAPMHVLIHGRKGV